MSEESEKIGVDIWMCGTIYVDAETDDEAEEIVRDRYAHEGFHFSDDIEMDDDDFMSSAVTFYGLGIEQKLMPEKDPVRDAAPVVLETLVNLLKPGSVSGAVIEQARDLLASLGHDVRGAGTEVDSTR